MVHGQQRACMPVYIVKSGDLIGCYRYLTHRQTSEYRATQLVSSIKHKLSHAIFEQPLKGDGGMIRVNNLGTGRFSLGPLVAVAAGVTHLVHQHLILHVGLAVPLLTLRLFH